MNAILAKLNAADEQIARIVSSIHCTIPKALIEHREALRNQLIAKGVAHYDDNENFCLDNAK